MTHGYERLEWGNQGQYDAVIPMVVLDARPRSALGEGDSSIASDVSPWNTSPLRVRRRFDPEYTNQIIGGVPITRLPGIRDER